jgi:hypothetical protein
LGGLVLEGDGAGLTAGLLRGRATVALHGGPVGGEAGGAAGEAGEAVEEGGGLRVRGEERDEAAELAGAPSVPQGVGVAGLAASLARGRRRLSSSMLEVRGSTSLGVRHGRSLRVDC